MTHRSLRPAVLLAASVLSACGMEAGGGDQGSLSEMQRHGTLIPVDPAAGTTDKAATFFLSDITGGAIASASDFVCMFTSIWGNWSSADPSTGLYVKIQNNNWVPDGARVGQVVCTKWTNFVGPPGSVIMLSDPFAAYWYADGELVKNGWWGDAAMVFTAVDGEFEGAGEQVWLVYSTDPFSSSQLHVRTQHETATHFTQIGAQARSVFVGVPQSGHLVKLIGYQDGVLVKGDASSSGTFKFTVGDPNGFSSYWMANFNSAVCYLTRWGGDMNDNNDKVTITQNGQQWFMRENGGGLGSARCMAYDQR